MKVIVSKEILQNEKEVKEKILRFIKTRKVPKNWAVNLHGGNYIFEYLDAESINLFGEVNNDYLEMIIGEEDLE